MGYTNYTNEPKNVLPKAKDWDKSTDYPMNFSHFNDDVLQGTAYYPKLHWLFRRAIQNPGVTQNVYFEENGYEYNYRATWNSETRIMITNTPFCPNHPHSSSRCCICG